MIFNCPGSQKFKQPQPENIKCPFCSAEAEIWTDEIEAICPNCKNKVLRKEQVASCLDWCSQAKECVGDETYNNYISHKSIKLKEKLLEVMEDYFGNDSKRINHAKKVMQFAEELLRLENADWHIVIPASILHDVGIKSAEAKYGSAAGNYQEKEGPAIARSILFKFGLKKEHIDEICQIIAHHHSPGIVNTLNFKVLYDADWLVNLKDEVNSDNPDKLKEIIGKVFLTKTGRDIAKRVYL